MTAGSPASAHSPFVAQLEELANELAGFQAGAKDPASCSDTMTVHQALDLSTRALAAIERVAGRESTYFARAESFRLAAVYEQKRAVYIAVVAGALLSDLRNGYTAQLAALARAEVFGDFLEMAAHLLASGYKDPAAVVAGSALEAHLRQLAHRNGVPTEREGRDGPAPKKAELLNSELAKADAYAGLDQKNVTAWLGLRNKAAHGEYEDYSIEQVRLMVDAVRDFLTRHPA